MPQKARQHIVTEWGLSLAFLVQSPSQTTPSWRLLEHQRIMFWPITIIYFSPDGNCGHLIQRRKSERPLDYLTDVYSSFLGTQGQHGREAVWSKHGLTTVLEQLGKNRWQKATHLELSSNPASHVYQLCGLGQALGLLSASTSLSLTGFHCVHLIGEGED